jgi:hypothetical protein
VFTWTERLKTGIEFVAKLTKLLIRSFGLIAPALRIETKIVEAAHPTE